MSANPDTVLERLTLILADYTDRVVLPQSNLITDLGMDSLSTMDIMLTLENQFQLSDLDYDPEHMQTVHDLAIFLIDKIDAKNIAPSHG